MDATPDRRPHVAGQPAADRLLQQIQQEARTGGTPPTPTQVAIVLHALADHTAIQAALTHRPDPTSPWPAATSVGRWFHDVADQITDQITDEAQDDAAAGNTPVTT